MSKKVELREGEEAAERFRSLAKKVVSVSKAEIDRRAKEWRNAKDAEKRDSERVISAALSRICVTADFVQSSLATIRRFALNVAFSSGGN